MTTNWKALQNGSDIRGVALEGVEGENVNLTQPIAEILGKAFTAWLSKKVGKPTNELSIAIGIDSRLSGPLLKVAVCEGINKLGAKVGNCGLASTPAMFMATKAKGFEYDGGIMLTASHLPFNRNGLKFFTNKGGLEKQDITDILALAEANSFEEAAQVGKMENIDFMSVYANMFVETIRKGVNSPTNYDEPLKGLHIVVDAGNGAGGFYADKVLQVLGANTSGSQFLDPNGHFPNHIPNPEHPAAMEAIRNAVLENRADFGIIFDTDVDRAAAVDKSGKEINRNGLIALISAILLEEHPGTTIVTDSITSDGLTWFIEEKLGGKHHRFKRGYKNVINEAIRLNNQGEESHIAIETSGHAALKENFFLDDGAYLVTKILVELAKLHTQGRELSALIEELPEPVEDKEYRINIKTEDFATYGKDVLAKLKEFAEQQEGWSIVSPNHEGVRVACDTEHGNGWLLMRLSLHDPVLPMNIESNSKGGEKLIADKVLGFVKGFDKLKL